jgi:hypothetical protein
VTRSTRISVLRALIARTFAINVRKKRIWIVEGGTRTEITEGDGGRQVGWFVAGRAAEVQLE